MPNTEKDIETNPDLVFFNFKEKEKVIDGFQEMPDLTHRTFLDFLAEVVILILFTLTAIIMFTSSEINQPMDSEYQQYSQVNYPYVTNTTKNIDGTLTKDYSNGVVVNFNNDGSYTAKMEASPNKLRYQDYP